MLINDFYTLVKTEPGEGTVKALIVFNKAHQIFQGHFPGQPVVPGVCMMQIVRDVMEAATLHHLKISTGDNMKFLSIINPEQNNEVEVSISYTRNENVYVTSATLFWESVTFFKFKGNLEKEG